MARNNKNLFWEAEEKRRKRTGGRFRLRQKFTQDKKYLTLGGGRLMNPPTFTSGWRSVTSNGSLKKEPLKTRGNFPLEKMESEKGGSVPTKQGPPNTGDFGKLHYASARKA